MENEELCCSAPLGQEPMRDGVIRYLNTDLDLRSAEDLTPLAEVLKSYGLWQNHLIQEEDGNWFAIFEAGCGGAEPEQTITMLLDVIEALAPEYQAIWSRCMVKEFNLGYQCGTEPRPFTQGVSSEVVTRMAAVNASLRITLYPDYAQLAKPAAALEPKKRIKTRREHCCS
ncbi:MAG: hypothetical protein R2867_18270 [Caldilineaceae bacterium]